ncbi:hypothetical protein JTE90_015716 [Oedothorax gibbosus]|uniref:Uncharacterized protein n=1 Tax=Oedothorax gibbosus TaxID=931172 RepID=A0AAV6TZI8_9ARAC|nr:hypothetical protein JTE90_015716 [Oedothorax gibbosus]
MNRKDEEGREDHVLVEDSDCVDEVPETDLKELAARKDAAQKKRERNSTFLAVETGTLADVFREKYQRYKVKANQHKMQVVLLKKRVAELEEELRVATSEINSQKAMNPLKSDNCMGTDIEGVDVPLLNKADGAEVSTQTIFPKTNGSCQTEQTGSRVQSTGAPETVDCPAGTSTSVAKPHLNKEQKKKSKGKKYQAEVKGPTPQVRAELLPKASMAKANDAKSNLTRSSNSRSVHQDAGVNDKEADALPPKVTSLDQGRSPTPQTLAEPESQGESLERNQAHGLDKESKWETSENVASNSSSSEHISNNDPCFEEDVSDFVDQVHDDNNENEFFEPIPVLENSSNKNVKEDYASGL